MPQNRRLVWLRHTKHASPAVGDALLDAAIGHRSGSPSAVEDLAKCALLVAERVAERPAHRALSADLEARALAHLANACRLRGHLAKSASLHSDAQATALNGTGDPLVLGELASLHASLAAAREAWGQLDSLLSAAAAHYGTAADLEGAARVGIQDGLYRYYRGDDEGAVGALIRAWNLAHSLGDHSLLWDATHNLALSLSRLHPAKSLAILRDAGGLMRRECVGTNRLRVVWLEARLLQAVGNGSAAAALYRTLCDSWAECDHLYESALCHLELAALLLDLGRYTEAVGYAATALQACSLVDTPASATAALGTLQRAVAAGTVVGEVVREVVRRFGGQA